MKNDLVSANQENARLLGKLAAAEERAAAREREVVALREAAGRMILASKALQRKRLALTEGDEVDIVGEGDDTRYSVTSELDTLDAASVVLSQALTSTAALADEVVARLTAKAREEERKRLPRKELMWLLFRIGSWTSSRWDQWLRWEYGDAKAQPMIDKLQAWLATGETPSRPR